MSDRTSTGYKNTVCECGGTRFDVIHSLSERSFNAQMPKILKRRPSTKLRYESSIHV